MTLIELPPLKVYQSLLRYMKQRIRQVYVHCRDQPGFTCIKIRQVPRKVLKTEACGLGFQHLPRSLANVNDLKNYILSLLLQRTENIG